MSTSSRWPLAAAKMTATCSSTGIGSRSSCLSIAVSRSPRLRLCWVAWSRSLPNCEKLASSWYWFRSRRRVPATVFIALIWAEEPTRLTELPVSMAGRWPALNRSESRKIWPSVIEMTLVGM